MNIGIQKNSKQSEHNKNLSVKEIILYTFEILIMFFDAIISLSMFMSGIPSAGWLFFASALMISPFCERFLQKFPVASIRNSTIKRIKIQIICSAVLFIIAIIVCAIQLPTNTSETITPVIETEQATFEEYTTEATEAIEETESTTTMTTKTKVESTTTTTETTMETTTTISETELTTTTTNLPEYDTLQIAFMSLSFDSNIADIEKTIKENNLEFTKANYNGTPKTVIYKLAYDKEVAKQKYGTSGDSLEIAFNSEDESFMYADYTTYVSGFMNALLYNYGTYWEFRFKTPQNQYSGYYYYESGDMSKDGIVFQYDNGNSCETSYHPCKDAEEALKNILDKNEKIIKSETKEVTTEEVTEEITEPPTVLPTEAPTQPIVTQVPYIPPVVSHEYWINTDSGKFHSASCHTIKNKEEPHWQVYSGSRDDLISQGYDPCGVCEP